MLENLDLDLSGKVIAKANPETGVLFTIGNNPDYCSLRVESSVLENDEGFWTLRTRTARIRLQVVLAKALLEKGLIKDGQELPVKGQIIVRESFERFYDGQEMKINPSNGTVILYMSRPVYRQSVFTSNMDDKDMLIKDYWLSTLMEGNQSSSNNTVPFDTFMGERLAEPAYSEQQAV
jgi:hypothetical protein